MKRLPKTATITQCSKENPPVYQVALNEQVIVETHDCYGGQIDSEAILRPEIDLSLMNLATGPIYIEKMKKGQTLCIDIHDIRLHEYGIMVTSPGLGSLGKQISQPSTRLLAVQDNEVQLHSTCSFPVKPMIGVVGVAPAETAIHCAVPGHHGGNMDTKDITIGNRLYLPVFHDGALVAFGDLHAAMGDGELAGIGVEVAGEVTVSFQQIDTPLSMPLIETPTHWMVVSSATGYQEAIVQGMQETVAHLQNRLQLSFDDAYRLVSATCDLRVSQIVNQLLTIRIAVPKTVILEWFPSS